MNYEKIQTLNFEKQPFKEDYWVSSTGYRTLLVLRLLIIRDYSLEELIEILKNDKFSNKALSKDTVRLTIKTLKDAGCEILRPCKSNNYKYKLISHPFYLNITDDELKVLNKLRNKLFEEVPYQTIIKLNKIYEKLFILTQNDEIMDKIIGANPLINIDENVLKQIANPKIIGKKTQILYDSYNVEKEILDIVPYKITEENNKMYLLCYLFKYNKISTLNVERILKVISVNLAEHFNKESFYEVIYKVFDNSAKDFTPKDYEEIIEQEQDCLTIKAKVTNDFWFIQRLLLFGRDFRIVSPDFFKEKLINKIKSIRKEYDV